MPASSVKREDHLTGDSVRTFDAGGSSPKSQGVTLCDASGNEATSLPLPSGAATEATIAALLTAVGDLLTEMQGKADLAETQPVSAASLPLPSGAATESTLNSLLLEAQQTGGGIAGLFKQITSADASPGSPYTSPWFDRDTTNGVRELLIVEASAVLSGTLTFEYSDDQIVSHVDEPVSYQDLSKFKELHLLNVGRYFRYSFDPDAPLASETVTVSVRSQRHWDGPFMRFPHQTLEEASAAMPYEQAFLSAWQGPVGTGTSVGLRANPTGQLMQAEFMVEVAKGNIPGHTLVNQSGRNPDVDQTFRTIWGFGGTQDVYTPPASAAVITFTLNVADSLLGLTAQIVGLSAAGVLQTEALALDAASKNSVLTYSSVQNVSIDGATAPAFDIVGTIGAANVFNIPVGINATQIGYYHVPAGKTAHLLDLFTSTSNNTSSNRQARLMARKPGGTLFQLVAGFGGHSQGGPTDTDFSAPYTFDAGSVIRVDMSCGANNNIANCVMGILLVDD